MTTPEERTNKRWTDAIAYAAMRELTTVDTFAIQGRGVCHWVYVGDTAPELHEHVLLDGQEREVVGVEWPIRKGHTAILVRVG